MIYKQLITEYKKDSCIERALKVHGLKHNKFMRTFRGLLIELEMNKVDYRIFSVIVNKEVPLIQNGFIVFLSSEDVYHVAAIKEGIYYDTENNLTKLPISYIINLGSSR